MELVYDCYFNNEIALPRFSLRRVSVKFLIKKKEEGMHCRDKIHTIAKYLIHFFIIQDMIKVFKCKIIHFTEIVCKYVFLKTKYDPIFLV